MQGTSGPFLRHRSSAYRLGGLFRVGQTSTKCQWWCLLVEGELKVKGLPNPPAFRCDEVTPVGNLRVVLWVWRPEFMSHSPSRYGLVENGV